MVVVTHHRIGGDIDGEDGRQLQDAIGNPATAMVEVLAAMPATKWVSFGSLMSMTIA
jgi:hypothetical protein